MMDIMLIRIPNFILHSRPMRDILAQDIIPEITLHSINNITVQEIIHKHDYGLDWNFVYVHRNSKTNTSWRKAWTITKHCPCGPTRWGVVSKHKKVRTAGPYHKYHPATEYYEEFYYDGASFGANYREYAAWKESRNKKTAFATHVS